MAGEPSPWENLLQQVQEHGQAMTVLQGHGRSQAQALTQQSTALAQLGTQGQAQAALLAQLDAQGQAHALAMAQLDAALQVLLARLPALPPAPMIPVQPVPVIPGPVLPVPVALPPALTPRPEHYSGDPELCEEFLTQCELQFNTRPGYFSSDSDKVNYILMLLKGNALKWARPYITRRDPLLQNFALFIQEFTTVFERQFHLLTRREEFVDLKQGSKTVVSYVAEFSALAAETTWEEEAKVTLFHRGLRADIKDAILSVHPVPETLSEFIKLALRIEHRLGDWKNRRKTEFRRYPVPGKPGPVSPDPSEPMVIGAERGPLTAQERDRRRQLSLCFYCGLAGHSIRQCPVRPAQGNAPTVQGGGP